MFTFLAFMSIKTHLCQHKMRLCIHHVYISQQRKGKESKGKERKAKERKGFLRRQAAEEYIAQRNRKFLCLLSAGV